MKTTIITREYPPNIYGGAGVHVDQLARALSYRIPVEVLCFGDQNIDDSKLRVVGFKGEEEFSSSEVLGIKVLPVISTNLAMVAKPPQGDVIHCHTWYSIFAGVLGRMLYRRPLIITAHSLEPLRPWKEEQLGTGYDLSSWIERIGYKMADRVIAVSKEMRDDILKFYGVSPERVEVIHNGVDPDVYQPVNSREILNELGLKEQKYILFVGRISRQKGIMVLLEAFAALNEPDIQLVLCASSPDSDEILTELNERISSMNNVIWLNRMVEKAAIIELYSHAAVFACPSIYEPFGIINLEAMSCGTPVVASRTGGIPEVVLHEETGLLVEPGDIKALMDALKKVINKRDIAHQFGEQGRIRSTRDFSWNAIAQRTIEMYERTYNEFVHKEAHKTPVLV